MLKIRLNESVNYSPKSLVFISKEDSYSSIEVNEVESLSFFLYILFQVFARVLLYLPSDKRHKI